MASSNPPAAAAAASPQCDESLARKWAALEQLTQVYGFEAGAAKQAIEVCGPDVEAACAFILDSGLGQDQGGPVVPIDNCPHLQDHVKISASGVDDSFSPSSTCCSYTTTAESTTGGATGKAKADVDDTGMCPSKENWFCLECGVLRCSRYVNGHGLMHWEETKKSNADSPAVGHCVALSLSDLSVWCYHCGAYVTHPSLNPILKRMEELKFMHLDTKKPAAALPTASE
ncbi:Histone deacetylase 6 [Seminavis robusta]|uniref:Histone deacetylase 6 n=1 Tax=Seminavis robusta TaxID=568900 RepID=A0A9N8DUJ4_9STRA|nr:Histone deacetylase 6 [Seminavis robusta]|eukprot:Sro382_g131070.1 Histone deacetylase 6 (229) ;mRNA; f:34024-34828